MLVSIVKHPPSATESPAETQDTTTIDHPFVYTQIFLNL